MASGNAYFPTGAVKSNNYKINESEIAIEVKCYYLFFNTRLRITDGVEVVCLAKIVRHY